MYAHHGPGCVRTQFQTVERREPSGGTAWLQLPWGAPKLPSWGKVFDQNVIYEATVTEIQTAVRKPILESRVHDSEVIL